MASDNISRRNFLATGSAAGLAAIGMVPPAVWAKDPVAQAGAPAVDAKSGGGRPVALVYDSADSIAASALVQWAIGQLDDVLKRRGLSVRHYQKISAAGANEFCIVAASPKSSWLSGLLEKSGITLSNTPETVALAAAGVEDRPAIFACGSDARGLMYALLEVADRVTHTDPPLAALESQKPLVEHPANSIRSVGRLFTSDVEDLGWYRDKSFWRNYLSMLAAERFNRFNLTLGLGYDFARQIRDSYFYFAYPFFLSLPGHDVRATNLSDSQRDENLAMLKFISDEAATRGLDFQLGIWCHAYQWTDSAGANYQIEGLNPKNHADYSRDAMTAVLKACPSITGVTIRTHGESGVTEGSYDFWETLFKGVAACGRKVEIDLHAKGIDQTMIDRALATGLPINVSPKYWAEHTGLPYHQASIRALEIPDERAQQSKGLMALSNGARKFMRYSYGDLLREDRKYGVLFRMWPGSMKLLLWGDPEMAAGWGRHASFCGSLGMEIFEPLSFKGKQGSGQTGGRNGYLDASLKPAADWEKFRYTYRLWGRMLYNPDTDPETWRRMLRSELQAAAPAGEQALAQSSRIVPLITSTHLPSAANATYLPEIYTNMSISDPRAPNPYSDTPTPRRFGTVSPLDPTMFATVDESAAELLTGKPSGKYSQAEVAQWLADLSAAAAKNLQEARKQAAGEKSAEKNADLARLVCDVGIQTAIGQFFAHKLRAGILYAIYEQSGDPAALAEAVKQYRLARDTWNEAATLGKEAYVADITFGLEKSVRGCWADRLPAIEQDVQRLAKLLDQPATSGKVADTKSTDEKSTAKTFSSAAVQQAMRLALTPAARPNWDCKHEPPTMFKPGKELPITLVFSKTASDSLDAVELHYRQVDQSRPYQTAAMSSKNNSWFAAIPADATNSPYPLQYFFILRQGINKCAQYPGFSATLCDQPYFVVRQV